MAGLETGWSHPLTWWDRFLDSSTVRQAVLVGLTFIHAALLNLTSAPLASCTFLGLMFHFPSAW